MITREMVIDRMKAQQGRRTQKDYAQEIGCSPAHLSDIYSGNRDPGEDILDTLNLRKVVMYEEKDK